MPDRIPLSQRSIGVNDAGSFEPVLPEVGSIGNVFGQLSRSLLSEADRRGRREAEQAAIEAAGVASIVKNENGFAPAEPPPPGGGRVYMEVYNRALDQRLLSSTVKDFERQMVALQVEHQDDPEKFAAAAQGMAEGYIKAASPRIAVQLEIDLVREYGERFRGLAEGKMRRDRAALVKGLYSEIEADLAEGAQILATGAADAEERATLPLARVDQVMERLVELGEVTPEGREAELRGFQIKLGEPLDFARSMQELRLLSPQIKGMSDEEVARLGLFAVGATDGGFITLKDEAGKPVVYDVEQFFELIPSETVRATLGSVARASGAQREQEARDALAAERFEAEQTAREQAQATAEAVLTAVRDNNRDPGLGYSKGEVAAFEQTFAAGGSTFEQMSTEAGRDRVLNLVASTGYMPIGLKEYIDAQVIGGNTAIVSDFVESLRSFNSRGTWVGQLAYEQLSADTRATLEYDAVLRRARIPDATRMAMLQDARNNRRLSIEEVRSQFKGAGNSYEAVRNKALAAEIGASANIIGASPVVTRDFDELMRHNLQLYGGNRTKAAEQTAKQVARNWQADRLFVGSLAPRKWTESVKARGVTFSELQRSLPPAALGGATFQNGRLLLRPVTDSNTGGYGAYWVQPYNEQGRPLPAFQVDMDDVLRASFHYAKWRARREEADAIDNAPVKRWTWVKDDRGVYRYMWKDEYREWIKNRPSPAGNSNR